MLFQTVLALGAGEQSHHRGRRGEQGPIPGSAGRHAQGHGQMRLAYAGRSEQQHVLGVGDVTGGGQLAHDLRIERGLELEVEALERLLEGEVGHADAQGRVAIMLAGQFGREQLFEKVAVGEILLGGGFQQRGEPLDRLHQAQAQQLFLNAFVLQAAAHDSTSLASAA